MRFDFEALWLMPIAEAKYRDQYWEYYGPKYGWEEVVTREVTLPHSKIIRDEKGNERHVCFQGGSYLRSTWRPCEKRSKGRRPENRLSTIDRDLPSSRGLAEESALHRVSLREVAGDGAHLLHLREALGDAVHHVDLRGTARGCPVPGAPSAGRWSGPGTGRTHPPRGRRAVLLRDTGRRGPCNIPGPRTRCQWRVL